MSNKNRSLPKNKGKAKRFSSTSLRTTANKYRQAAINASPRSITPVFFDSGTPNGGQMVQHSGPLLDDDDDDTPAARPGHKKNAMSNFLSIFSFQPKRKSSSSTNDFEAMTDLEVLKLMKKNILDILSKMIDIKKLKKIKAELKEKIWDNEYTELKSRLSLHDIHTSMNRQKLSEFASLQQYTTIQDDDVDNDMQEAASYLLQEFFDHPAAATTSRSTLFPNGELGDIDDDEEDEPEQDEDHIATGIANESFVSPLKIPRAQSSGTNILENRKEAKRKKRNKDRSKSEKRSDSKSRKHKQRRSKQETGEQDDDPRHYQSVAHRNSDQTKHTHLLLTKKTEEMQQPTTPNTYTYEQRKTVKQSHATHIADESTSSFPDADAGVDIVNIMFEPAKLQTDENKTAITTTTSDMDQIATVQQLEQLLSGANHTLKSPRHCSFLTRIGDKLKSVLSTVGTWDFDPFELYDIPEAGDRGLVLSTWYLMDKYNLFALFPQLSLKRFLKFMDCVEQGYLDNPYHNQMHATDVVSNVAFYLNETAFFQSHCSDFDKFCAILSAAIHDLGHDGNNNAYHITTMSDIALTYNDISVLENYHIAMAFKTLKRPECNWYKQLSMPVQRYLRQALIDMVLATDMKYHNQKLASLTGLIAILKQQLSKDLSLGRSDSFSSMSVPMPSSRSSMSASNNNNNNNSYSLDELKEDLDSNAVSMENLHMVPPTHLRKHAALSDFPLHKYKVNERGVEHLLSTTIADVMHEGSNPRVNDVLDERRFVLCWMVHLCDISNCAKSIKSGKKWAVRVMTEFFKQGDREKSQGLEVSAMMDRHRSSIASGQIGFIKFVLYPSYNMWLRLVPEASRPVDYLNENLAYWQEQQKQKVRQQRSKSLGAGGAADKQALLMMQDQLKRLQLKRDASETPQPVSPLSAKEVDDDTRDAAALEASDDDDDDTRSQKSVRIRDDDEDEDMETPQPMTSARTYASTAHSHSGKQPSKNGKHVGFAEQIVVVQRSSIASNNTNNDEADDSLAPLQNRVAQRPMLSNTKARAHSIHVSIPTSDKQLQSQPQPFSEVMAMLTKQQLDENKRLPKSPKLKARPKSDHLETIRAANKKNENKKNPPNMFVSQSTSVPIGSLEAEISADDHGAANTPNDSNGNHKKQKRDMV